MRHVAAGLIGVAVGSASGGPVSWLLPADGVWSDGARWSSGSVPGKNSEDVLIGVPGTYTVTLNTDLYALGSLSLTNPDASLSIPTGRRMFLHGAIQNNGYIGIRSDAVVGTSLTIRDDGSLSGSGQIRLIQQVGTAALVFKTDTPIVHGADHTIAGSGRVEGVVVNLGAILADDEVGPLSLNGDWINHGRIEAASGGVLLFEPGSMLSGAPGGSAVARSGRIILDGAEVHDLTLESEAGGDWFVSRTGDAWFSNVRVEGSLAIDRNATLNVVTNELRNDGAILVNTTGERSETLVILPPGGVLSGSGVLALNGDDGTKLLGGEDGVDDLIHESGHTITGSGLVSSRLLNRGLIASTHLDDELFVWAELGSVNEGTIAAYAGRLTLQGGPIAFPPGGGPVADGGEIALGNVDIGQATVRAEPGSSWAVTGTATARTGTSFVGDGMVRRQGGVLNLDGDITMNAHVLVEATIRADGPSSITGAADIHLYSKTSGPTIRTVGSVLTLGEHVTISGRGRLEGDFVNRGTVLVDDQISIRKESFSGTAGTFVNEGLVQVDSGVLNILDIVFTQSPQGRFLINGGLVQFTNGSTLDAIRVDINTAADVIAGGLLDGCEIFGDLRVTPGGNAHLRRSLRQSGVLNVGDPASADGSNRPRLTLDDAVTLLAPSAIRMYRGELAAENDGSLTIEPGASLRGRGEILAPVTNRGTILADDPVLYVRDVTVDNQALIRIEIGGEVELYDGEITQTDEGLIDIPGGFLVIREGGRISGGRINSTAPSSVLVRGGHMSQVRCNADIRVIAPGTLFLYDWLENDGVIGFDAARIGGPPTIRIDSDVEILGSGAIDLAAAIIGVGTLRTGPDQTVRGGGVVGVRWLADGPVEPGPIDDPMHAATHFTIGRTGIYRCDIASPTSHDVIVTSRVTLGGTLEVIPANGFAPTGPWSAPVVTYSFSADGAFERVIGPQPDDPALQLRSWIDENEVLVGWVCTADTDVSGTLDIFDILLFIDAYQQQSPYADLAAPFGAWNFFDIQEFLRLFNEGCP